MQQLLSLANLGIENIPAALSSLGRPYLLASCRIAIDRGNAFELRLVPEQVPVAWIKAWDRAGGPTTEQAECLGFAFASTDPLTPSLTVMGADVRWKRPGNAISHVARAVTDALFDRSVGRLRADPFGRNARVFADDTLETALLGFADGKHRWIDLPEPKSSSIATKQWKRPTAFQLGGITFLFQPHTRQVFAAESKLVLAHVQGKPVSWRKDYQSPTPLAFASEPFPDGTVLLGSLPKSKTTAVAGTYALQAFRARKNGDKTELVPAGREAEVSFGTTPLSVGPAGVLVQTADGPAFLPPASLPEAVRALLPQADPRRS